MSMRLPKNHLGSASSGEVQRVLSSIGHYSSVGPWVKAMPGILAAKLTGKSFFDTISPSDLRGLAMAIPEETGQLLYLTARATKAHSIVEFGTSFGASTIYLACAVKDNGGGKVISSEIEVHKAEIARDNLALCGLSDIVEVRVGDALRTLSEDLPIVDMIFLDGWKNLYLPLLRILEPRLRIGGAVLADNMHSFPEELRPYLDYISQPNADYSSAVLPIGDGIAYSVRQAVATSARAMGS